MMELTNKIKQILNSSPKYPELDIRLLTNRNDKEIDEMDRNVAIQLIEIAYDIVLGRISIKSIPTDNILELLAIASSLPSDTLEKDLRKELAKRNPIDSAEFLLYSIS